MTTPLFSLIALFALLFGSDACVYVETADSVAFKEYNSDHFANSDAIYNFEYGSDVSIVYDNGENLIYYINEFIFKDRFNNNKYPLLNNNDYIRDEYQNNYDFLKDGICIEFKIKNLTPLTDNKHIICKIVSEVQIVKDELDYELNPYLVSEIEDGFNYELQPLSSSARIIGYNNMNNTKPKYVKSGSHDVYPFTSELRFYCHGYGDNDNISVHLIDQHNTSTMVVNNSMVVSGMDDDYKIERGNFNTFLFTMNKLTKSMNNSMVVCSDSHDETKKRHTFNVMGFHLGGESVTTVMPDEDVTTTFPEESVTTMLPDEDVTTMFPDEDVTTMFPDEDVTTMFPDEDVTTMFPDEDYESITDPTCVTQPIESTSIVHNNFNEATHYFFCAVKKSNPLPSVAYYYQYFRQYSQFTVNMTNQMVQLNHDNSNLLLFKLPVNNILFVNNNHFVTCNVTQPSYGKYPEVVKSCTFENV